MPNLFLTALSFAIAIIFLVIVFITSAMGDIASLQWGTTNYFEQHGFLLMVFIGLFPRLTLLFSSIPSGGILWWVSWFIAPRVLVAVLATFAYSATNPFLVFLAWVLVFAGESGEKYAVYRRAKKTRQPSVNTSYAGSEAIEVSYKVKSEK